MIGNLNSIMQKCVTVLWFLVHGIGLWGQQPGTVQLDHNPVLRNQPVQLMPQRIMQADTIDLPFIDDFSYYATSAYPDPSLWVDHYVFINNDYPQQPRSNGVATFDALDANGQVYTNNAPWFYADTLTSRPINLSATDTSVFFSFFFQPQGLGDNPETGDSLILQFKSPITQQWRNVWSTPGMSLCPFQQVVVDVSPDYCHKGFQFRFMNIVSLDQSQSNPGAKSNVDHWHIDYVRLNKNKDKNLSPITDVAMIAPINSMIKGYQSIPWNQFPVAYTTRLEPTINITYRNNDVQTKYYVSREFDITDVYRSTTTHILGGGENIEPDQIITFDQDVLSPFISPSVDSALFELKGYILTINKDRKANDTVRYYQKFQNYFARDDGIPESGYGYREKSDGFSIACRYETFMPDSLRAISFYFNPTDGNVTTRYVFQIAVWRDDNGRPGEQVYLSQEEYSPKTMGKFTTYLLEKSIYVTKYYWIGWKQVTTGFLNVGFDRNYNDKGNLWYNSTGSWQPDANNGTLMIRPIVGKRLDIPTSIPNPEEKRAGKDIKIYPNPASQYIYIETAIEIQPQDYHVEIYGENGQLRYRALFMGNYINVSHLEQGLYVVCLVHQRQKYIWTQKIVIIR